jgi:hypothetical protein
MKYILIPIIAFGLTLSMLFGIEYNCECSEPFPTYYGSPFVFMQESLGSSMEYYYSISGLILNTIIWSLLLVILRCGIIKLMENLSYTKILEVLYKIGIGLLLVFAILNIWISYMGLGRGFNENLNYWYWNLDKEAKDYRIECVGNWKFGAL